MKKYLTLFLLLIPCIIHPALAQSSTPSFPVGKTFLIRGYPMDFNADTTYSTYSGSTVNACGVYEIKGQTISLTDTASLYLSRNQNGKRITGTYNWTYKEGKLWFTVIDDKADSRRTALLEAPLLPGDKVKKVIQVIMNYGKACAQGDVKTVAAGIHDDYQGMMGSNVQAFNKTVVTNSISSVPPDFTITYPELKVRVVNETAIVTGQSVASGTIGDKVVKQGEVFTTTLIWLDGRWQPFGSHHTKLPDWRFRELADSDLKPLKTLDCTQLGTLKSLNTDVATYIRFSNTTNEPVTFTWINYEGKPETTGGQSEMIAPRKTSFRFTYLTHPFVIPDAKGTCLGIYQPTTDPSIALIDGK